MTQFCPFLWLIFHSIYAPQLFPSHFLSQDQGQKISACRKTHKLVKRLLTSIEHHNLKVVTRTSPGAVVKMYRSSVYSCEPWWWPHKGTRSPPPAMEHTSAPSSYGLVIPSVSVWTFVCSPLGSAVTGKGQEEKPTLCLAERWRVDSVTFFLLLWTPCTS